MRNVLSVIVAVASLGLLAGAASAQAPTKIGFIDSRKILQEAPGAKEAQATFSQEMEGYQAQLKVMEDSLKALMDDYQQKAVTLSPEAKKKREDDIRARQTAYQQRAQALQQEAGNRQAQLVQPVLDRIGKIINEIRAEGHYAYILDVGGDNSPVVAADSSLDLTDEVIARMTKATASATPTAPSPPAASQPAASQPARKP
jgi:outer membrane protein